jgi:hypothetical protein
MRAIIIKSSPIIGRDFIKSAGGTKRIHKLIN